VAKGKSVEDWKELEVYFDDSFYPAKTPTGRHHVLGHFTPRIDDPDLEGHVKQIAVARDELATLLAFLALDEPVVACIFVDERSYDQGLLDVLNETELLRLVDEHAVFVFEGSEIVVDGAFEIAAAGARAAGARAATAQADATAARARARALEDRVAFLEG